MEKTDASYQTKVNGITFKVVLASNENAKLTFEELVKKCIQQEAVTMPAEESA